MEKPSFGLKEAINGITVNQKEDLNLPSGIDVLQCVMNYNNSDLKQVVWCVGASRARMGTGTTSLGDRSVLLCATQRTRN